jgi:lysophospholipase
MDYSEDRIDKLFCGDGRERSIYIWEPQNPSVVLLVVHGAMDHAGAYSIPALYFRKHGIASVALNQRGHDHRGPDHPSRVFIRHFDDFLDDLGLMLEKVKKDYPGLPVFFLAHSMGSLICTHFGIRRFEEDPFVRGFILSSPYYVNAVKAPKIVLKMAGILSAIAPRMKAPIEDIIEHVTHDREIRERHRKDQQEGIKATEVSILFGNELLKAQQWLPGHIEQWKHPLLVIVAGADRLADAGSTQKLVGMIEPGLVTELYYPENYHENYNEPNREEIFSLILKWIGERAPLPGQ